MSDIELLILTCSKNPFKREIGVSIILVFLLPSDNVQHDHQPGSLITFPKEENLGNKRKSMHQVSLPSVPTSGLPGLFAVFAPSFSLRYILNC